jgi:hypothetical protein
MLWLINVEERKLLKASKYLPKLTKIMMATLLIKSLKKL